jgi:hypothetical protein
VSRLIGSISLLLLTHVGNSPAARMQEERVLHEAKLAKMEAEMKMVFQQKVQEKEAKLKQSEEELYARHKEMKDALEKQRADLEEKKKKIESGRPITPEKSTVSSCVSALIQAIQPLVADRETEGIPSHLSVTLLTGNMWLHCCMYLAFLLLTDISLRLPLVLLSVHISQRTHS